MASVGGKICLCRHILKPPMMYRASSIELNRRKVYMGFAGTNPFDLSDSVIV